MDNDNRELLTRVIAKNLDYALEAEQGSEEGKTAFKHAMEAIDRESRMCKDDDSYREVTSKLETEKEKIRIEEERVKLEKERLEYEKDLRAKEEKAKRKEVIATWIFRGVEIVAVCVAVPLIQQKIDLKFKRDFASVCMDWESTGETFTSLPGRSIKEFFRFKR